MLIRSFEDIIAWKKSQDLAVEIYKIFGKSKDFGFRDQICRASLSISNNIAEGFDRDSKKEFIRFLYYAKGSCSEVKSMLYLGERLSYLNKDQRHELQGTCDQISRIIRGLIKSLK